MNKKKIKYFNLAKQKANLSDFDRIHIGCIAVNNNKILSTGFNSKKTHPLQAHYDQFRDPENNSNYDHSLHAEMSCLIPLWNKNINWKKVDLYIYRIRKDIGLGLAYPCKSCITAIKDLGIKNVYYTTNNGFAHLKL